jgi:hypothetical protein
VLAPQVVLDQLDEVGLVVHDEDPCLLHRGDD